MNKTIKNNLTIAIYLLIIIVSFFKVYNYTFDENVSLLGDNAGYYILGKSISQGEGYSNIHTIEKSPANHFPPGYPLIVSGVITFFSDDFISIKQANGFFFLISLIVFFFIFRKISSNINLAFIASFLLLFNYHFLMYSSIMMSEISFVLFSALSLLLFIHIKLKTNVLKQYQFYLFLITLTFAVFIKTIGIGLLGAYLLYLIIQKNWKPFIYILIGFTSAYLPWFLRSQRLGGSNYFQSLLLKNPYQPELGTINISDWFSRIFGNAERYITREIPYSIFPLKTIDTLEYKNEITCTEWIIGLLSLSLIIWGLVQLKKYRLVIFLYLSGIMSILLIWPEIWVGVRFMLALTPIVFLLFVYGFHHLSSLFFNKFHINKTFITFGFPFLLLLSTPLYLNKLNELHEISEKGHFQNYKDYFEIAKWIKNNASDDAVICCRKPQLLYLKANRFVTSYKKTLDQNEFFKHLESQKVKYVIFDQLGYSSNRIYLAPIIQENPRKFKLIKQIGKPKTSLFEFLPQMGYHGERKENKRHGTGSYYLTDKVYYIGEWKNHKREGEGTFFWPDGSKYQGQWKNDIRHGIGTYYWKNGNIYVGGWVKDLQDGPGELIVKGGKHFKGVWKEGELITKLSEIKAN